MGACTGNGQGKEEVLLIEKSPFKCVQRNIKVIPNKLKFSWELLKQKMGIQSYDQSVIYLYTIICSERKIAAPFLKPIQFSLGGVRSRKDQHTQHEKPQISVHLVHSLL